MHVCGEGVPEGAGQRSGRAQGVKAEAEIAERSLACFQCCVRRTLQEWGYKVKVSSSRTHPQSKKIFLYKKSE